MKIAVCAECGRFLKFVKYTAEEAKGIYAPDGAGYMVCKKCGPQSTWGIVDRKARGHMG